jgi:hypothetical protein
MDWMDDVARHGMLTTVRDKEPGRSADVALELPWMRAMGEAAESVLEAEPTVTAPALMRSLKDHLTVRRLIFTPEVHLHTYSSAPPHLLAWWGHGVLISVVDHGVTRVMCWTLRPTRAFALRVTRPLHSSKLEVQKATLKSSWERVSMVAMSHYQRPCGMVMWWGLLRDRTADGSARQRISSRRLLYRLVTCHNAGFVSRVHHLTLRSLAFPLSCCSD